MYLQEDSVEGVIALAHTQVLGEGKTIEEAINNGLAKLQVEREHVNIEIVEEPSKGFFGRKSGRAAVRLTLKQTRNVQEQTSSFGLVSVKHGKLEYVPPQETSGVVPTIRFGSELQVLYTGELVEKEVKLTKGLEPLEIILPASSEPELHYEIVVDAKKTKAQLVWKRTPGVNHSLADHSPTNQLQLSIIKHVLDAPALELKDVQHLIQIEGLKYGLQIDGLTKETLSTSQGSCIVALGEEPTGTRHPSITYVFQEDAAVVDDDALRIDHYAVHGTEGVHEGAILAVKDPGEPGKPGMDVYGDPIPGEPLRKVELAVGEGVRLSDDGLQAIATTSGLPSVQSGVLRVTNVFELPGDADVSTGNITMDGDIIIKGNVMENVKVQSNTGVIVVNGLVSGGTVRTGGSITVLKNVLRSQLYAGGISVTQIRVLNLLKKIANQLEALEVAYDAIVSQADNIPFENLIRHLIELKFSGLPKDIKELSDELDQIAQGSANEAQEFAGLSETLEHCLLIRGPGPLKITDVKELRELRQSVGERIKEFESQTTVESDVKLGYLQNSRVEASGSVEVSGKGCFYSTVLAGNGFKIANGVFRGGQVTVNAGAITAKELGGPKGIATTAQVLTTGRITSSLVHPNVTVIIGSQSYKFDETTSLVKVFLQDNLLTVYSGSNKIHG